MNISADDFKTFISAAALIASFVSLWFTRFNWIQSNRPIVTAFITEHDQEEAGIFDLVMANTGNRPAVRVRMLSSHSDISSLVEEGTSVSRFKLIESNFCQQSEVPLLRNGEELTTSFGAIDKNSPTEKWLRYGAEIQISITYADLEGRMFESKQPLKVYARNGFGGGIWVDRKA